MKIKEFFVNISIRHFCRLSKHRTQAGIIKIKEYQTGRSMVEMLGVLAVIGVLSVGGIIGYKYAMTKYIANETINELNLRAHDISLNMDKMIENNYVGDIQMGMGPITRMGFPITARISPQYVDYFEIFIKNIPSDVCRELLRTSWKAPYSIFVGIQEYEANSALCNQAEEVDLAYEFYKDLTPKENIDENKRHETQRCNHDNNCKCGTCNSEQGLCESYCLTGENCKKDYDDPRWMVCCDKDYIKGEYCCASITEDGKCCNREGQCCPPDKPLQDKNGNCHSCNDINPIELTNPDTCSVVCPKRFLNNEYHKRCILCGVEGTAVENKPIWDYAGNCYACDDTRCIDGGGETLAQEATAANCSRACSNKIKNGAYCCPICPNDKPLLATDNNCYSCDDTTHYILNEALIDDCETLCPNRKVEGRYCIAKTCPPDKPLRDINNICHSCDDINGFGLANPETCSVICPKRFLNNQHHKQCTLCGAEGTDVEDKPIWDFWGNCYACDDSRNIHGGEEALAQEATAANCSRACPNRIKIGPYCAKNTCPENQQLDQNGVCHDKCTPEKPLRDQWGTCYTCDEAINVDVTSVTENCNVCTNRKLQGNYCVLKTCPESKPLRDMNGRCYSCDDISPVVLTDPTTCSTICPKRFLNNQHHKRCILCGVAGTDVEDKPIWDWNGSCYSCDDPKKIDGGGEAPAQEATAANCSRACPNRAKENSFCVRKTCPSGMFERSDTSTCFKCNITTNVPSTEEECNRCINRVFENGYCTLP